MKFRTEIEIQQQLELSPQGGILAVGSCFADRVGGILTANGLDVLVNPFGVIYNPVSLSVNLENSISGKKDFGTWEEQNGKFVNLNYHGSLSQNSVEEAKSNVQTLHSEMLEYIKSSNLLIVTWGTAFVYEEIETGKVVTNCHRFPSDRFLRRLLNQQEIVSGWEGLLNKCFDLNPDLEVILTVSPVRHVRDSLVQNQLSKSSLHLAVHQLVGLFKNVNYFPSYEIMMDDLRDYRFYEENLVQPNSQALQYIIEKFQQFCFTDAFKSYWKEAESIVRLLNHKVINDDLSSKKFVEDREKKLKDFREKFPFTKL